MKYLKPLQPDPYLVRPSDMTPAKFGHLNVLVNAITELEEANAPAATVAALAASTNITAVPGSFADEAAVQAYLATAIPIIETRLDNIEAKINAILVSIKAAGLMA